MPRVRGVRGSGFTSYKQLECSDGCKNKDVGDGVCNTACLTAKCNYDMGDCCNSTLAESEYEECQFEQIGNGVCDLACNITECVFDYGDCFEGEIDKKDEVLPRCFVKREGECPFELLTNDECDRSFCGYSACNYDKTECFPTGSKIFLIIFFSIFGLFMVGLVASECLCGADDSVDATEDENENKEVSAEVIEFK